MTSCSAIFDPKKVSQEELSGLQSCRNMKMFRYKKCTINRLRSNLSTVYRKCVKRALFVLLGWTQALSAFGLTGHFRAGGMIGIEGDIGLGGHLGDSLGLSLSNRTGRPASQVLTAPGYECASLGAAVRSNGSRPHGIKLSVQVQPGSGVAAWRRRI